MLRIVSLLAVLSTGVAYAEDDLDDLASEIDKAPSDGARYGRYARKAFAEGRFELGIEMLKVAGERIPDYLDGTYLLAYAYRKVGDWPHAVAAYRAYIERDPKRVDSYFGLGQALEGAGDRDGAFAAYEKYVRLENSPAKQSFVAQAKQRMGELKPELKPPAVEVSLNGYAAALEEYANALAAERDAVSTAIGRGAGKQVPVETLKVWNEIPLEPSDRLTRARQQLARIREQLTQTR